MADAIDNVPELPAAELPAVDTAIVETALPLAEGLVSADDKNESARSVGNTSSCHNQDGFVSCTSGQISARENTSRQSAEGAHGNFASHGCASAGHSCVGRASASRGGKTPRRQAEEDRCNHCCCTITESQQGPREESSRPGSKIASCKIADRSNVRF